MRLVFGHKNGGSCGCDHGGSFVIFNGDSALNDVETLFAIRVIVFEKHLPRLERERSQVSRCVTRCSGTEQRLQATPTLVFQRLYIGTVNGCNHWMLLSVAIQACVSHAGRFKIMAELKPPKPRAPTRT